VEVIQLRSRIIKTWVSVCATVAVCAAAQSAHAVATLRLDDTISAPVSVVDNTPGDANPLAGVVTFIGSLGSWTVNVTTGITKPALGSAITPSMDLNSVNVSSSGAASLIIEFTETDFGPLGDAAFDTNVGGSTGGSASFAAFLSEANTAFGTDTQISGLGSFSGGAFSGATSIEMDPLDPFALTLRASVSHTGAVATSFNMDVQASASPVPQPATMLLLASGVLGVAGAAWKRTP
jgi:hypothetical protein